MNWEEIDKIEREVQYESYATKGRRLIAPSVEKILSDFDDDIKDGEILTEESFHKDNEEIKVVRELMYLQTALAQTLRWQSFCQASS